MQATRYNNPVVYYAKLGNNMLSLTQRQCEAIERKFMLESKKDVIDYVALDKYFTQLTLLLDDVVDEFRGLTSMILERE